MHHFRTIVFTANILIFLIGSAGAKSLTEDEECAIGQAEVAAAYTQCLSQARIEGIRESFSDEEVALLSMECEATMFEEAEALALTLNRPCDLASEALETQDWSQDPNNHRSKARRWHPWKPRTPRKPQIPKHNFEWNGRFVGNPEVLSDPQVVTDLTIRGKWDKERVYFNVYMEQGNEYSEDLWVQNWLFEGKLYTITRKWHTDGADKILNICFENMVYNADDPDNPFPITVDGLNALLDSSRFVSLEIIGGIPMNHFRTTCLSEAGIVIPPIFIPATDFKVFSDIYVPPGRSYPWTRWLQYGDGVGPDPQEDEWFLFDEWNREPDDIILPPECKYTVWKTQQMPCSNLFPKSRD